MSRFLLPMIPCLLVNTILALKVNADDPPKQLTAGERKVLEAKLQELNEAGIKAYQAGKPLEAIESAEECLKVARRLYNPTEFPDGHDILAKCLNNLAVLYKVQGKLGDAAPLYKNALEIHERLHKGRDHADLAASRNNLALLYQTQGKLGDAEPLLKDALEMYKRLFKGQNHPDLARALSNLASLYKAQGKLGDAEPLFKDALEMRKQLFKGQDHPELARSLINLAFLHTEQGKLEDAEPLHKDALEMTKRLFKGQDHPDLATSLNNLAELYRAQGKLGDAALLCKEALEMRQRLFKSQDHPQLAISLSNYAGICLNQGKLGDAEPFYKDALEMNKRLFKGQDHHQLAQSLNNLAFLYQAQGKAGDAKPMLEDALGIYRRLAVSLAQDKTEGEILSLQAQQPSTRDAYLSVARDHGSDPAGVYAHFWADKGFIARVYERRLLQSRAAAADPKAAEALRDLIDARRRRAELLLAPATRDPASLAKRKQDFATYESVIENKTRELKTLLPASVRADKLEAARPADLQKVLPAGTAVVDFIRFVHFTRDKDKPMRTPLYLAFVVTKLKVMWVDLGAAAPVESAVNSWRASLASGMALKPELSAKVRELVWEKVRKELPAGITTVYVCPDAALCKVPFAALPGDKPDTILLEDFAVAVIPHAPFLLDKLWPPDPIQDPPTSALVVGGVKYDAAVAQPAPGPNAASRGSEPLLKPGAKPSWKFLGNTMGEANGVAATAERRKLPVARFDGDNATSDALLKALPRAKYAHFATHGYFADPSFRSVFQLDEKDYENRGGERVGKAALSPLVMTGLVFAGANHEKTPGRGIVTGEQLIDLDLSGLQLAVLSACETGLGDVAGGQGTFGLQRAFHYAGTTNVMCSLWKVPDESTAALMGLFYRNLWEKNLSPVESLRQAQIEIYKNPKKIGELAKGFRGKFEEVAGEGEVEIAPGKDGKAHPMLWAAFTLSGPGK